MSITVNWSPREFPAAPTVAELLAHLELAGRPVVVEINEAAILPRDYPAIRLADGDRLEIVTLAAGG
jgi:sulfur carrier protein